MPTIKLCDGCGRIVNTNAGLHTVVIAFSSGEMAGDNRFNHVGRDNGMALIEQSLCFSCRASIFVQITAFSSQDKFSVVRKGE